MQISNRPGARPPLKSPSTRAPELPAGDAVLKAFDKNFDQWDLDGNGRISWSEMRRNVANPEIKGRQAVALATLYGLVEQDASYRGVERKAPLSYERMQNIYDEYQDDDTERSVADSLYAKFRDKLAASSKELFPQSLPNAHMAKQGTAPSCGFLATTFAEANKDPRQVREAVTLTEDGKIKVKFPGLSRSIVVEPLTDTERALFATAEENGTWLTTLEKAWGVHEAHGRPLTAFEQSTYPEDAIEAWTGGEATTSRIPKHPKACEKGELPDYLRTTERELASNHIAIAWTRFDDLTVDGLVPGHAYTLNGIDYEGGKVSLRNPWGRFEPTGKNGKPLDGRDDGAFEFPLSEFHKNFGKIARQTA